MTRMDGFRRYIEAASSLGEITRSRAEALVKELAASGEIERAHTKEWVDTLVKESKKRSDFVIDQIRREINRQISDLRYQTAEEAVQRVLKMVTDDSILSSLKDVGKRAISDIIGGAMPGSPKARAGGNKMQGTGDAKAAGENLTSASMPKAPARKPATRPAGTTTKKASARTKTSGSAAAKTANAKTSPSTRSSAKTSARSSAKTSGTKPAARRSGSTTGARSSSSTTRTSSKR